MIEMFLPVDLYLYIVIPKSGISVDESLIRFADPKDCLGRFVNRSVGLMSDIVSFSSSPSGHRLLYAGSVSPSSYFNRTSMRRTGISGQLFTS